MNGSRVLIVGCGDIGIPLARQLVDRGAAVWGLRRNPDVLPDFIQPVAGDVTRPATLAALAQLNLDYVVVTLTPAGRSEAGYRAVFVDGLRNVLAALGPRSGLRRLVHVSSTSVYHQHAGEWVDEASPTQPETFAGVQLLAGEQLLRASGVPATVVRFAGIYGPGRRRLLDQVRAGVGCPQQPAVYTNRIHRDDCVGVLLHLLQLDWRGTPPAALYVGVDCQPVPMWEVRQWLAARLGVTLTAPPAEDASARRGNKRCSNARLLAAGYQFRYPDFRAGYAALLASG